MNGPAKLVKSSLFLYAASSYKPTFVVVKIACRSPLIRLAGKEAIQGNLLSGHRPASLNACIKAVAHFLPELHRDTAADEKTARMLIQDFVGIGRANTRR